LVLALASGAVRLADQFCSDFRFRWFPRTMHPWPFAKVALPLVLCVLEIAAQCTNVVERY